MLSDVDEIQVPLAWQCPGELHAAQKSHKRRMKWFEVTAIVFESFTVCFSLCEMPQ
jgi:hypothetical protein